MSILLQKKNVGDYSYMSSPNIYYRAENTNIETTHIEKPYLYLGTDRGMAFVLL